MNRSSRFIYRTILFSSAASVFFSTSALAQSNIVPDDTLGRESSEVIPNFEGLSIELITGGATRGQNLFHSFEEFNIQSDRGAYFANPEGIANIISRVTGNNASDLLGVLGVAGTADLYFVNPNGIIFGDNASLDVGGSFIATTADGIQFGEQGFFSATEPNAPPLLTVNPSAFFFNQVPGNITNNSVVAAGSVPNAFSSSGSLELTGLRVPDGENLLLLGGNIEVNNSLLVALDGNVELGSVSGEGNIALNRSQEQLNLSFPENLNRGSIVFNRGGVENGNTRGGTIALYANSIDILQGSSLGTGVVTGFGTEDTQAGDITLEATERITFAGINSNTGSPSLAGSIIQPEATGNTGDVNLTARDLILRDGAAIASNLFGQGNGGKININVESLSLSDSFIDRENNISSVTTIFSGVGSGASGNGGEINIRANEITLSDGAQISAGILNGGEGNGGNINIEAQAISLDGAVGSFASRVSTSSEGVGDTGNIQIQASELSITNGARIDSSISDRGSGGLIDIEAESITLENNAQITANTFSEGNAGIIAIASNTLTLNNLSSIDTVSSGRGSAGMIQIETTADVFVDNSSISSLAAIADAGEIQISGNNILLANESEVSTNVTNRGNAGSITIEAAQTFFSDNSNIGANVGNGNRATGDVGEIEITANRIEFSNTAQIQAGLSDNAEGNAGNVELTATESITFTGVNTGIATSNEPNSIGDASNIMVTALTITLQNNAGLFAVNRGEGDGGNIIVTGENLTLSNDAFISSAIANGTGGDITLQLTEDLILQESSTITARAFNRSTGGNLDINSRFIVAFPGNNDIIADAVEGNGGEINITAESIFNLAERDSFPSNDSNDIDASSDFGLDGAVSINTPDVDPARGLENLPTDLVDASSLISRSCLATTSEKLNQFTMVGKGGLVDNPESILRGEAVLSADWLMFDSGEVKTQAIPTPRKKIIEADSFTLGENGELLLASSHSEGLMIPWLPDVSCN